MSFIIVPVILLLIVGLAIVAIVVTWKAENRAREHTTLGNALAAKGQLDDAIAEYRKAIELDPNNAEAPHDLGVILSMKEQHSADLPEYRSNLVVEAYFSCTQCDQQAGNVQLSGNPSSALVQRESFTSGLTVVVRTYQFDALRCAIEQKDAATLYELDLEYVPFYCPECGACYCGDHWKRRDVFDDDGSHDSIRGTCPKGHERMLED